MMRGEAALTVMPRGQEVVVPPVSIASQEESSQDHNMPGNRQGFRAPWRFASGIAVREGLHGASVRGSVRRERKNSKRQDLTPRLTLAHKKGR
jgi:hypothetical protein